MLVWEQLAYPTEEPVKAQRVLIAAVLDVKLDDGPVIMFSSAERTNTLGVYEFDVAPLPEGYYHVVTQPDDSEITVVVPSQDPPHDAAHLVPGTTATFGYRTSEIRVDDPQQPGAVVVGLVVLVGDVPRGNAQTAIFLDGTGVNALDGDIWLHPASP